MDSYSRTKYDYNKLADSPRSYAGDFDFGETTDRRFAFSRHARNASAAVESHTPQPVFSRSVSSIDIPPVSRVRRSKEIDEEYSSFSLIWGALRSGNKHVWRLFVLISLNVAYSSAELFIGLFSGRSELVSDAFHLTFGCGLLSFSLLAMATSRSKSDRVYTYGFKRLEVLAAFTNALFLLFMSFSLAVEALHAFIQDESEHKHYLIISAVTNLLLIPFAGLILASWLLNLGVNNAEVLCLGLVSVTVFMLVMPLFKATGGVLLQMAPPSIPASALSKCWRQVKQGMDDQPILQYVHGLYHDIGVQDLTVQTNYT